MNKTSLDLFSSVSVECAHSKSFLRCILTIRDALHTSPPVLYPYGARIGALFHHSTFQFTAQALWTMCLLHSGFAHAFYPTISTRHFLSTCLHEYPPQTHLPHTSSNHPSIPTPSIIASHAHSSTHLHPVLENLFRQPPVPSLCPCIRANNPPNPTQLINTCDPSPSTH